MYVEYTAVTVDRCASCRAVIDRVTAVDIHEVYESWERIDPSLQLRQLIEEQIVESEKLCKDCSGERA